ncbi:MAG: hypothetical protein DRQ10_07350 [Candidatus Hydrothermota bacterium]|nr:MAG: hypothetical protein DRQ10_07350 [Candidatus Hydrothermae bacterium]
MFRVTIKITKYLKNFLNSAIALNVLFLDETEDKINLFKVIEISYTTIGTKVYFSFVICVVIRVNVPLQ